MALFTKKHITFSQKPPYFYESNAKARTRRRCRCQSANPPPLVPTLSQRTRRDGHDTQDEAASSTHSRIFINQILHRPTLVCTCRTTPSENVVPLPMRRRDWQALRAASPSLSCLLFTVYSLKSSHFNFSSLIFNL